VVGLVACDPKAETAETAQAKIEDSIASVTVDSVNEAPQYPRRVVSRFPAGTFVS
jgi:hypothetical protein